MADKESLENQFKLNLQIDQQMNKMIRMHPFELIVEKVDSYIKYTPKISQIHVDDRRYFNEIITSLQREMIVMIFKTKNPDELKKKLDTFNGKIMNIIKAHFMIYIENAIDNFYNNSIPLFSVISKSFRSIINSSINRNIRRHPDRKYNYTIDLNTFRNSISSSDLTILMLYACTSGLVSSVYAFLRTFQTAEKPELILSRPYYFIIKVMDELYMQLKPFIEMSKIEKDE